MEKELKELGFTEYLPNEWYILEIENEFETTQIVVIKNNMYLYRVNKCEDILSLPYDLEKLKTLIKLLS